MATNALSQHFASFFGRLNPGASFEATTSSQYNTIKDLIEDPRGLAAALSRRSVVIAVEPSCPDRQNSLTSQIRKHSK
jgi:hypothetical protein